MTSRPGAKARVGHIADIGKLRQSRGMDIVFDATWDRRFKGTPYWLRFELGGEQFGCTDAPVPRFVQAITRARTIRDAVFTSSGQLWAVVVSPADPSRDLFAPAPDGFAALSNLGFKSSTAFEWRARLDPDEAEQRDDDFIWRAFDLTADVASQDALVWASVAYEMPVEPKAPVISHFVDYERGMLLHVYDDRGMDVLALTAASLLPFYRQFDPWLLDHDRERMEVAFDTG